MFISLTLISKQVDVGMDIERDSQTTPHQCFDGGNYRDDLALERPSGRCVHERSLLVRNSVRSQLIHSRLPL